MGGVGALAHSAHGIVLESSPLALRAIAVPGGLERLSIMEMAGEYDIDLTCGHKKRILCGHKWSKLCLLKQRMIQI